MLKLIQTNITFMWMCMYMIIFMITIKLMHPVNLMIFMVLYNLISCLSMSIWKFNFMYSIILFLIMISGLLIIFMYFSSLISNEQMNLKLNLKFITLFILNMLMLMYYFFINKIMLFNKFNYMTFETTPINFIFLNKFYNLINLFNYPLYSFTLFSVYFILFAFLTIIKINSASHSTPMRKLN